MQLGETQMKFIRRWGDMGTRWGIPRSTAMLHGLLYVAQAPLAAEEMCELLQLARSNVSTSLKELEGYTSHNTWQQGIAQLHLGVGHKDVEGYQHQRSEDEGHEAKEDFHQGSHERILFELSQRSGHKNGKST